MADHPSKPGSNPRTPPRKVRIFNHRRTGRFGFEDQAPVDDRDAADATPLAPEDPDAFVEMRYERAPDDPLPPVDDMQLTQPRPDGYNRPKMDSQPLPFADSGYIRPTAPSAIVDGGDYRRSLPPVDNSAGGDAAAAADADAAEEESLDHANSHDLRLMFPHLTQRLGDPAAAASDVTATAAAPTQAAPSPPTGRPLTGAFGPVGPATPPPSPIAVPTGMNIHPMAQSDAQREALLEEAARNLECTGEVFGDFLLIRRYPAGGFGEVWLARDTALDKNVVVKRLQPEHLENKRAFYQFDIEIEIGRRIKHPNLVPILKSGVINGRRFFTMPEIAGPSLTRVLQGKSPWPLSTMDILGALEAIGRALGFMHRAGVIHADVKPDNLLFASRTRPMLIDLGLARTMNWEETGYRALKSFREDRSIMGTPEYMAPELIHGDPWEIGPSVDVYALGVILYEVLAGRPPYSRPSRLTGEALAAALQKIMDEVGTTPPRPILEINPNAPAQLVSLAMQCLSKDPAERPQSADNVSAAIARFLRPAANFTVANKPSALSRMTRWLRKPN